MLAMLDAGAKAEEEEDEIDSKSANAAVRKGR
jgi:hypothetical protein